MILAGISIATLSGEGGILNKATYAREQTKIKEGEEAIKLKISEVQIENKGQVDLAYLLQFFEDDENIFVSDIDETEIILEYGDHAYRVDDKIVVTYLGTKNEWEKNSFQITKNLSEGVSIDNKRKRIQKGEPYYATILVEDGVQLSKVEVKMGEEVISIDTENRQISIAQVTDNIVITTEVLAEIEIFEYMRSNGLTPSEIGFIDSWNNPEYKTYSSSEFYVGRGTDSGKFSASFKLPWQKIKSIRNEKSNWSRG